jgi:hypothetical protein
MNSREWGVRVTVFVEATAYTLNANADEKCGRLGGERRGRRYLQAGRSTVGAKGLCAFRTMAMVSTPIATSS